MINGTGESMIVTSESVAPAKIFLEFYTRWIVYDCSLHAICIVPILTSALFFHAVFVLIRHIEIIICQP